MRYEFEVGGGGEVYLEGRFNGGFFALRVWGGGLYLEGLEHGGAYFQNFTVSSAFRVLQKVSLPTKMHSGWISTVSSLLFLV